MKRQLIINYDWFDSKNNPVSEDNPFIKELEEYSINKICAAIYSNFKKGSLEIEIDAGEFIYEYHGNWRIE